LSYTYLSNLDDLKGLLDMALRRYVRLTIPIAGSALIGFVLLSWGAMFHQQAAEVTDTREWLGVYYRFEPSLWHLVTFSLRDVYFAYNPTRSYNPPLWTMSAELAGSFLIFGVLALINKWPRRRLGYVAVALMYLHSTSLSFVLGCLMADIDIQRRKIAQPPRSRTMPLVILIACAAVAVARDRIALYLELTSLPSELLLTAASCGIVWTALTDGVVKGFLGNGLSRVLGNLSFPLYLVHFLVLVSLSSWLLLRLHAAGVSGIQIVAVVASVTLVVTFAASTAFWFLFERTSIRVSRRISKALL
jgi:peptidoglycan/LPS O-acetylase OafA/YrhL